MMVGKEGEGRYLNIIDAFIKQNRKGPEKAIKVLQQLTGGQSPLFGMMQKRFQRRGRGDEHNSLDFCPQR